jgi:phenylacetate-CoA ligase
MSNLARISYYLLKASRRLRWDKDKLREYQNKQLRKVVKYAYDNVLFYRQLFKTAGVKPSDIRTADDLNKLPIVRKSEIKKRHETDLVSREFNTRKLKLLRTGGSTGEPFSIYISRKEDDWRKAIYMRANISCGQRPRDRWVAVVDAERVTDTTSFQHLVGVFAQKVIPVVWSKDAQLKAIEKLKPDVLDGFSNALWLLAREVELRNVKSIHPRIMFGSGDLISQSSREYLEKVFGVPYYDQFGCTEIDRSAWQCPEKGGYHMDVDSVIMQFVDEDEEEVRPDERGEIVYTSLFNYAMPFIRYGIQDVGVPIDDECSCGRKLPLMKVVEGRSNSFLFFPDGHVVAPTSFIEIMKAFRLVKEIDQYRVVQKREDLVEIYVKKTSDSVNEERLRNWLVANILEGLSKVENVDLSKVRFKVRFVEDLPLTGRGKLTVVFSFCKRLSERGCL